MNYTVVDTSWTGRGFEMVITLEFAPSWFRRLLRKGPKKVDYLGYMFQWIELKSGRHVSGWERETLYDIWRVAKARFQGKIGNA